MRFLSLSSGSDGNCLYVEGGGAKVLIDAGISGKKIEEGLAEIGVNPSELDGLFITHEHSDHNKSMGFLQRKYGVRVYSTTETLCACLRISSLGRMKTEDFRAVTPEQAFKIRELTVMPYSVSHDAANPVAYTFTCEDGKIGMATDLGYYDERIVERLKDSTLLYLESNHDVNMLMVGRYPYVLKQRIAGDHGHLSNETCAKLSCELLHEGLKDIILAHLSQENNFPELAYETVKAEVHAACRDRDYVPAIEVAKRGCVSVYKEY